MKSIVNTAANPRRACAATLMSAVVGAGTLLIHVSAAAQSTPATSRDPISVVKEFLANTAPDKVDAAAKRLVAPDATYVSLNFSNPELKQIEPWAGTSKGPKGFSDTFSRVATYWKIEDFQVTDIFGTGEKVAVFGKFT